MDILRLDEHPEVPLAELAHLSGLSETELASLLAFGVVSCVDPDAVLPRFSTRDLDALCNAAVCRSAFELTPPGLALALTLLRRVADLEDALSRTEARLGRMAGRSSRG